jgi:sarcosine oxidase subunit gamma
MSAPFVLAPHAAFTGLRLESGGVAIVERDGAGLATVQARKGRAAALRSAVAENFALELPMGTRRVCAGGIAFAGTGPGTWLASKEDGGNAFAASLSQALGDLASVADQSDGLGILRLSGPRVRDVLARLVPIDVHSRAFNVGDVASTVSGYVGVTLWRLEDGAEGAPAFEIALYRSFAGTLARALGEIVAAAGGPPA